MVATLIMMLSVAPATSQKTLHFIGFSSNERLSAWESPEGIKVVDNTNNTPLATLRKAEWQRFRKGHPFSAKKIKLTDNTVRIQPDADSRLTAEPNDTRIIITSDPGSAIGFSPIGRMMDGELASMGHFRIEGQADVQLRCTVEVYISPSGRHVATLAKFDHESQGSVFATGSEPLAGIDLGARYVVREFRRGAKQIFKQLHPDPEIGRLYDELGR